MFVVELLSSLLSSCSVPRCGAGDRGMGRNNHSERALPYVRIYNRL